MDSVGNRIISHVQVLRALPTRLTAILFQVDCTLVVLLQDSFIGVLSLILQEVINLYNVGHKSSVAMSLVSMELQVFNFCLPEPVIGIDLPKDIHPHVFTLTLGWAPWELCT